MKALYLIQDANGDQLVEGDMPVPSVQGEQLLIRVHAAGVTPTELSWYPTTHTKDGGTRIGAVPGHEFSGVVAAVGPDSHGFLPGDEVYGMNDWFIQGASAEYCLANAATIAHKPVKLSHAQSAVVPIGALTAWQGLFTRANIEAGERILVHGGSGSVGSFVIQLAKIHGAEVIATCSHNNLEFVRSLNADQVIDYGSTRFEEVVSNIDVVFDTVGGDTLERSWGLLGPLGRLVTIAAGSEAATDQRTQKAFFIVEPDHQQLADVARLLDGGALRSFLGAAVRPDGAAAAYRGATSVSPMRGKTALLMA